ncbi:SIR2 family protein [Kribbella qitaiheensis]|uniref:SIR2 family protein n=1 Tax=Kribbella qitaiheensis TaxID=1544730 RepID=UPI0036111B84
MTIDRYELVGIFGGAVDAGVASLFVGAGLSAAAGLPTWSDLLSPLAAEIGVAGEFADLPLLAEYYEQNGPGRRPALENHLRNELSAYQTPAESHHLIAKLPIDEIWTTNFDSLLETAAADASVATRDNDALDIGTGRRTIIKMHGGLSRDNPPSWTAPPVITRSDFEQYEDTHPRMWALLRASYLTRTMLFLGFSFADPNIDVLLRLARRYDTTAADRHLTVLRRPADPEGVQLHELRVRDLENSGVHVCEIGDFSELTPMLRAITTRTRPERLFVSGSGDKALLKPWYDKLAVALTARPPSWQLASLGGPAGWGVTSRLAELLRANGRYRPDRFRIYFRRNSAAQAPLMDAHVGTAIFTDLEREELVGSVLDDCRALLVICGGSGTSEEVRWALERGVSVIPLASSGATARAVWDSSNIPPDLGGRPCDPQVWHNLADPDPDVAVMAAMTAIDQAMCRPRD